MASIIIVWTETAKKQRREILKYWTIRNKSTKYAEKLIRLISTKTSMIAEKPLTGKFTNHNETREAAMGNFSIYYKYADNKIFILAFWDNRQDPDKLIELF